MLIIFISFVSIVAAKETRQIDSEDATEVIEGVESGTQTAEVVRLQFSPAPRALTPNEIAAREEMLQTVHLADPPFPESDAKVLGPDGGETIVVEETIAVEPEVPGTFTLMRNTSLAPTGGSIGVSDTNEPAVAVNGKYVFYTGNWYAARSTNGGSSWSYVDPYADMSDFCCDQDVIYDKSRDIFIWYRQGVRNSSGVNRFRLGVSTNGGSSWCFWNWYPTNFNSSWTNQWWDYPHLALSNNYLYFTTNMFNNNTPPTFVRAVFARASLDSLRACGTLGFTYWTQTSGTWTPVQGSREIMYVGRSASATTFTVWKQPESSTTLTSYTRTIPTWTTGTGMSCPLPNGDNPCNRSDSRVKAGWVAKGEVGFFWNVKQGSGFTYPYVNAATFYESTLNYKARPYIWSGSYAWHYAAASPNERGDLGVATWLMGGGYYPRFYVAIDDDFNAAPPGWEVKHVVASSTGPGANTWGDYLRVRPNQPAGLGWSASGYISTTGGVSQPRFTTFGRERDQPSVTLWWNQP
jgi:hypothetical protein